MDHQDHTSMSGHGAMGIDCDGNMHKPPAGSWKGHFLPGCVFIIWGSWWAYNACLLHLWRRSRQPIRSQAWYPLAGARLVEPILKVVLPFIAVSIELYFDHLKEGFQHLYCVQGTKYAGRFAGDNINNWQHAAIYPAFVLSGLVDLISTKVPVPPGTNHAFLGVAVAIEAFLMGTHEKHEPQDKMVHFLLFVAMLLCLVAVLTELHAPYNPLPRFGRAAATILQGAWLVQIAAVEYDHLPQWEPSYGGGAMMAPVFFCMIGVLVVACTAGLYLAMAAMQHYGLVPAALVAPFETSDDPCHGNGHSHMLADVPTRPSGARCMQLAERKGLLSWSDTANFECDSAMGSSDNGSPQARSQGATHFVDNPPYTRTRDLDV